MKKLLALVLAALMIFAMAACTPAEPNGGDNESGDNQQVDSDAKVVKIGIFEPASGDNGAGENRKHSVSNTQTAFRTQLKSAEKHMRFSL